MPTSPARSPYVRKQLSVTAAQNRELKRRSVELGVSEAEVVRRALDAALIGAQGVPIGGTAVDDLIANTRRLAESRRLDAPFNRSGLYGDRGQPRSRR